MNDLDELIELWINAPAYVQTYLCVQYPELWEALNKVKNR